MKTSSFFQNVFSAVLVVSIVLFTGCYVQKVEQKQINVVFRFDDYSSRSSTDMELRIIDAFRNNKSSITFGVIPFISSGDLRNPCPQDVFPLTSMKANILKTAFKDGTLEIALHGYSHHTIDAKHMTEFSGLDYSRQVERIAKGKQLLEEMICSPITTFVPPWNTYDLNTLRALEKLRFSTLSASRGGPVRENSLLNFLPATCILPQLRAAVKAARLSSDIQPVIIVLFHEYDFREIDARRGNTTYQEFYDLLMWLKSQADVRLLSIGQATKIVNDLNANRFLLNKRINSLWNLLPSFLLKGHGNLYADSAELLRMLWLPFGVFYLTIATLAASISFMIGYLVFPKSAFIANICKYGSIAMTIIILIYAFLSLQISFKGMTLSIGAVSVSIGIWLSLLYLKKKRLSLRKADRRQ